MKIIKLGKHISNESHQCLYCGGFLRPTGFMENRSHHFPWGILYECGCQKSQVLSNFIRSEQEFVAVISGKEWKSFWSGFCNDKFCPFCYSNLGVIFNGLVIDSNNQPYVYINSLNALFSITDYDKFIDKAIMDYKGARNTYSSEYLKPTREVGKIKGVDIAGCNQCKSNRGIIAYFSREYGEGEYEKIYEWCKRNKDKIPEKMKRFLKKN
jgi:hypothetical protein